MQKGYSRTLYDEFFRGALFGGRFCEEKATSTSLNLSGGGTVPPIELFKHNPERLCPLVQRKGDVLLERGLVKRKTRLRPKPLTKQGRS